MKGPWHEKQPYWRKSFSPFSASVWFTRSGSRISFGRVEVAQLVLEIGDDVARLGGREVVLRHPRPRVEGVRVPDEGEKPAAGRPRGDLRELGRGAVSLSLDGVAGDAAGLREELLPVRGASPAGSASAALDRAAARLPVPARAKRALASASMSSGERTGSSGIVAFGSTAFGPFSQRRTHSPPVFTGRLSSGGASERNFSWSADDVAGEAAGLRHELPAAGEAGAPRDGVLAVAAAAAGLEVRGGSHRRAGVLRRAVRLALRGREALAAVTGRAADPLELRTACARSRGGGRTAPGAPAIGRVGDAEVTRLAAVHAVAERRYPDLPDRHGPLLVSAGVLQAPRPGRPELRESPLDATGRGGTRSWRERWRGRAGRGRSSTAKTRRIGTASSFLRRSPLRPRARPRTSPGPGRTCR